MTDDSGKKILVQDDKTGDKIYSWKTYRTYMERCNAFADWCKSVHKCRTLEQCWQYRNDYIQSLIDDNKSAYTIKLEVSALAKLYGKTCKDFIDTPPRKRKDITRSRNRTEWDKHFSEKRNSEIVDFCRCTGLRRLELEHLKGTDLIYIDDKPYIHVNGAFAKGGRERNVPITALSQDKIDAVVNRMNAAGSNLVWEKVPAAMDVHKYRGDYAYLVYLLNQKDPKKLPREQRYYCRGDKKGTVYDKSAMLITSKALGHNRINIIASNYLNEYKPQTPS